MVLPISVAIRASGIAEALNMRGIATPRGGQWWPASVRSVNAARRLTMLDDLIKRRRSGPKTAKASSNTEDYAGPIVVHGSSMQ